MACLPAPPALRGLKNLSETPTPILHYSITGPYVVQDVLMLCSRRSFQPDVPCCEGLNADRIDSAVLADEPMQAASFTRRALAQVLQETPPKGTKDTKGLQRRLCLSKMMHGRHPPQQTPRWSEHRAHRLHRVPSMRHNQHNENHAELTSRM